VLQRVFKAFQYRDFRMMWFGACTSSIGTWMQSVAQSWLIYKMTNSAFLLGLDQFLGGIPIFLFSLVGGVVADRFDRRHVLLASQYTQMSCALTLTFLVLFNAVHVWQILCLSFVSGLAQAFGGPAYQALIPGLVKKEDMPNAIALNSIQFNAATVIGPTLGGLALVNLGNAWCFGLNAVSFLAPIISLSMLTTRYVPARTAGETVLQSMKQGFGFIRRQGSMEALIVLSFLITFLSTPMRTFLPVFAKQIFQAGPTTFTTMLSVMGVGSIVGALIVAALGQVRNRGRVALGMVGSLGIAMFCFSQAPNLPLALVALFFGGISTISVFAMMNSLVQLITPDEMRGRVMSVYNFAFRGGMPMGNLLSGWLVPIYSAPAVLATNGGLLVLLAAYFLVVQRRVAKL
jgi:MFS family permease